MIRRWLATIIGRESVYGPDALISINAVITEQQRMGARVAEGARLESV